MRQIILHLDSHLESGALSHRWPSRAPQVSACSIFVAWRRIALIVIGRTKCIPLLDRLTQHVVPIHSTSGIYYMLAYVYLGNGTRMKDLMETPGRVNNREVDFRQHQLDDFRHVLHRQRTSQILRCALLISRDNLPVI